VSARVDGSQTTTARGWGSVQVSSEPPLAGRGSRKITTTSELNRSLILGALRCSGVERRRCEGMPVPVAPQRARSASASAVVSGGGGGGGRHFGASTTATTSTTVNVASSGWACGGRD